MAVYRGLEQSNLQGATCTRHSRRATCTKRLAQSTCAEPAAPAGKPQLIGTIVVRGAPPQLQLELRNIYKYMRSMRRVGAAQAEHSSLQRATCKQHCEQHSLHRPLAREIMQRNLRKAHGAEQTCTGPTCAEPAAQSHSRKVASAKPSFTGCTEPSCTWLHEPALQKLWLFIVDLNRVTCKSNLHKTLTQATCTKHLRKARSSGWKIATAQT